NGRCAAGEKETGAGIWASARPGRGRNGLGDRWLGCELGRVVKKSGRLWATGRWATQRCVALGEGAWARARLGEWAMYDCLTPLPAHLGGRKTAPPLNRVWAIPVTVATPWLNGWLCSWWDGWATLSIPPRCLNGKEEEQSPRHSRRLFWKKLQV